MNSIMLNLGVSGLKSFFLLHFCRYPKDESPEAMLFKKKARILIDLAKSRVLDALGMPFWLSSGTCLGKIFWVCLFDLPW